MIKSFKRIVYFLIILAATYVTSSAATPFENEKLNYVISYKFGLIHKDAGEATLSLKRNGTKYDLMLTAKTKPWADKIYEVRDTLKGTMRVNDLKPLSYTKITHENKKYKRDEIKYSHEGSSTKATTHKIRYKDGVRTVTEQQLSASGHVYDMLSVFYYLRKLNYDELTKNKIYTATIFSGNKKETIRIKCLGTESIKLKDNTRREAYHIRFNFTSEGGKKSSDDIDTWISTDAAHIPLYLVGKLPLGEVRAYFIK